MSLTTDDTRTSDDLLASRRLRSFELALETTRRRLFEADEEIGRLHAQVAELERRLETAAAARDHEPSALRNALAAERARARAAEQALWDERERRDELERELELSRAPWSGSAERELAAAQRRVRELEGELEVVRRHAAEFEQAIRVAVGEAWEWLGEIGGRLQAALREQHLRGGRGPAAGAAPGPGPRAPRAAVGEGSVVPAWSMPGSSTSSQAPADPRLQESPGEPVRGERLDQALARLRDTAPAAGPEDLAAPASDDEQEPLVRRLFHRH